LPIPDRERIPRMQTFSSAFPPVWLSYLTVIRRKHWSNSSHVNAKITRQRLDWAPA
jgi:hypothetical protein